MKDGEHVICGIRQLKSRNYYARWLRNYPKARSATTSQAQKPAYYPNRKGNPP